MTKATPSFSEVSEIPFSPTSWQPLRILTFYRVVLAGLLTVLYFALQDSNPFNAQNHQLFSASLLTYLVFALAAGFGSRLHWPGYQFQALIQVLIDIAAIALLMHATGGATSALGVLLVIAVAAGALILPGRPAYLFAAVATLTLLFETGLTSLSLEKAGAGDITRAGLLGLVLFAAAGLAHVLAIRIRDSEALAQQRGIDLANLQQLNQYIIQQLQSGVLVVDPDNDIRLANETAHTLLELGQHTRMQLEQAAPGLAQQLHHWKNDSQWQAEAIQAPQAGSTLIARFSELPTARGTGTLILLEDSAQLAHKTQQIKLASLGRLTASIAHEIRNPLGAISHAAQLLAESDKLDPGDKRLTEIIGNHCKRVNTIIENILQLSRRSASHPQELALADWLTEFRKEFVQMDRLRPQQLELDIEPQDVRIHIDPGHLHQVLTNLCQNAFDHGGDETEVRLQVRRGDKAVVWLDVLDNGPGIDAETAEQMF
ncbi:MAG: histidine kinase dimerization/phospho-acceptor domain-containing protein, partial [Pseudomonadota bacterium]|nr:histidine kinase dimerization/phospho-acceptor domain-containing protein [Pseudomonadota bacterium]